MAARGYERPALELAKALFHIVARLVLFRVEPRRRRARVGMTVPRPCSTRQAREASAYQVRSVLRPDRDVSA